MNFPQRRFAEVVCDGASWLQALLGVICDGMELTGWSDSAELQCEAGCCRSGGRRV